MEKIVNVKKIVKIYCQSPNETIVFIEIVGSSPLRSFRFPQANPRESSIRTYGCINGLISSDP